MIVSDSIGDSSILHSVRMPVQRQDSDDRYSMTQIPRGYFLILTYDNFSSKEHKERKGNDKDRGEFNQPQLLQLRALAITKDL